MNQYHMSNKYGCMQLFYEVDDIDSLKRCSVTMKRAKLRKIKSNKKSKQNLSLKIYNTVYLQQCHSSEPSKQCSTLSQTNDGCTHPKPEWHQKSSLEHFSVAQQKYSSNVNISAWIHVYLLYKYKILVILFKGPMCD